MSPSPGFILDAGKPGSENVICIATAHDAMPRLSADMQGPALTVMKDVRGTQGVLDRFQQALGSEGHVVQNINWNVIARKTPPAEAPEKGAK